MTMNSDAQLHSMASPKFSFASLKSLTSYFSAVNLFRRIEQKRASKNSVLRRPSYTQMEEERRTANYLMEIHFR